MKFLAFASLVTAASAFTAPSMTFAVGKKGPAKAASKTKAVAKKVVAKKAPAVKAAATKKVVAKKVVAKKVVAKKVVAKKVVAKKVVVKKAAPKKVVKKIIAKAAPKKVVVKKVVKKAPVKKVLKKAPVKARAAVGGVVPSRAIPFEDAPAALDGSLVGDVGFDPCFLSTKADSIAPYFNSCFAGNAPIDGLTWYREAELMHGRICMVAALGFVVPGFGTFAGNDWTGADAFATTNPLEAISAAPSASLFQIFAFMGAMEFRRINFILQDGASYQAGDAQKWGQGEGRWNPLGFNYSPEEYEEKQLQELKHARTAMIGFLGLVFQANASGVNVVEQWSSAFTAPEYFPKAGYFFPEGI